MPIKFIPLTQLQDVLNLNVYYQTRQLPKKTKTIKTESTLKKSIDRYNKNYTIFAKNKNIVKRENLCKDVNILELPKVNESTNNEIIQTNISSEIGNLSNTSEIGSLRMIPKISENVSRKDFVETNIFKRQDNSITK
jgi:lysyl-tRNA synthetase class I